MTCYLHLPNSSPSHAILNLRGLLLGRRIMHAGIVPLDTLLGDLPLGWAGDVRAQFTLDNGQVVDVATVCRYEKGMSTICYIRDIVAAPDDEIQDVDVHLQHRSGSQLLTLSVTTCAAAEIDVLEVVGTSKPGDTPEVVTLRWDVDKAATV